MHSPAWETTADKDIKDLEKPHKLSIPLSLSLSLSQR